jgi:hypothetical protein
VELQLNGTHQLLLCADGVDLFGGNVNTTNKITEALIDTSEEVGLEVNTGKTE